MVEAMSRTPSCKRLVLMHSWFTKPETRSQCPFFLRYTLLPLIRPALDDMDKAEANLRAIKDGETGADVEWTLVCPPGLNNGPATGKRYLLKNHLFKNQISFGL